MGSAILFVFSICFFTQISFSQVLKEASPELAGMSSDRLLRIDKVLQEYVNKKWIAGGSAIIARGGKIVLL